MATSSIGVPFVLTDEMADKIYNARKKPAKKIHIENKKLRFATPEEIKEAAKELNKCYGSK